MSRWYLRQVANSFCCPGLRILGYESHGHALSEKVSIDALFKPTWRRMGTGLCCPRDRQSAEERLPLKLTPGTAQARPLAGQSVLASHPAPDDFLDPAFEQMIDAINLDGDNDAQNRDHEKFEQFLRTVESVQ
jgi:hypothetical protein